MADYAQQLQHSKKHVALVVPGRWLVQHVFCGHGCIRTA